MLTTLKKIPRKKKMHSLKESPMAWEVIGGLAYTMERQVVSGKTEVS